MDRNKAIFPTQEEDLIPKALQWAQEFEYFSYFNPNRIAYPFEPFLHFIGIGGGRVLRSDGNVFQELRDWHLKDPDWFLGFLGYDIKNQLENLQSINPDYIEAPESVFYQPDHLIFWREHEVEVHSIDDPEQIFWQIKSSRIPGPKAPSITNMESGMLVRDYLNRVQRLRQHIIEGDLYEVNLCFEFKAPGASIEPLAVYRNLNRISPMPFSSFHRFKDLYVLSASPERFLRKIGPQLISQPIKGTVHRGLDFDEDLLFRNRLAQDEKERAENMMIVDLVRNDLARSSTAGTVEVNELFGIYSFKYVHQMISTVTSQMRPDQHFTDAIKYAFPMGSMTGAPKIKAMELIEQYENSKRGIFSGTAGYIAPSGDFDFAVVIRSIIYHHRAQILSFQVGSAITYDSDPEKEYQECLLKARPIFEALGQKWPGKR